MSDASAAIVEEETFTFTSNATQTWVIDLQRYSRIGEVVLDLEAELVSKTGTDVIVNAYTGVDSGFESNAAKRTNIGIGPLTFTAAQVQRKVSIAGALAGNIGISIEPNADITAAVVRLKARIFGLVA